MATVRKVVTTHEINPDDPNVRDPEHAHELGGTLGMAAVGSAGAIAGGAAAVAAGLATTAAGVALAGPLGAVIGAAIGGAIGGAAGEAIASEVNPTAEEEYWSQAYVERPYIDTTRDYNSYYRPAYRYGIDSYSKYRGQTFDAVEPQLRDTWEKESFKESSMSWDEARHPARDAYTRLTEREKKELIS